MSPATVTPTKHAAGINNLTTTGTKKNASERLLFRTVLATQDLQQKCTNILDVLNGNGERAKSKVPKKKKPRKAPQVYPILMNPFLPSSCPIRSHPMEPTMICLNW